MFDLRDVEIVQDVVRAGGFRAAAQKYGLSQSAISTRVAALEKRLGVQLFDRVNRQVRLTAAGRRFMEEAARLLVARDRVVQNLTATAGLSGTVRIGVAESIVHTILSAMLNHLKKQHGNVRFELSVDTSEGLGARLLGDEIDVAILLRDSLPETADSTPLSPIALGWYRAQDMKLPSHPLSLAELACYPIITFLKATPPHREVERLLAAPNIPAPELHGSASLSSVRYLVADGFGIGVLPVRMAETDTLGAALRPIDVVEEARISALQFVVAYLPDRNRAIGETVTQAALLFDHIDHF